MKTQLLSGITALVACCVMMAGCEKGGSHDDDNDNGGGDQSANISGTWTGTGYVQGERAPTKFVLNQDGNTITGIWDDLFNLTGTFDGNALALFGKHNESGIAFTMTANATYNGKNIVNMNGVVVGKKGRQVVSLPFTVPTLTRGGRFALDGAGIAKTLLDKASASLK
jgi:hypothetical protein